MLFDACKAMCELMQQLGIAIDGGKDSLSMAARVGETTVKAPGNTFSILGTADSCNYAHLQYNDVHQAARMNVIINLGI